MIDKYLKIIEYFGINTQLKKLNEEVWELEDAIRNYEKQADVCREYCSELHVKKEREHIIEEMGDVLNLLTQLIFKYEIEKKELDKVMDYKLDRTIERIENKYYDKGEK